MQEKPKLYYELAEWFTTLTAPEDYAEEAAVYHRLMQLYAKYPSKTLLELGSGTGNNAVHLKQHYTLTLVDLSPEMIEQSKKQNPECAHLTGDMRSVRLNQQFDVVFIHDAIMYMTTLDDLRAALATAAAHCKLDGVVMVVPDCTRETFSPYTSHGGHDKPHSLRYLEWVWQSDPDSHQIITDFTYLIRGDGTEMRCVYDRHICGLFSQAEWLECFESAGLKASVHESPVDDEGRRQPIFIANKPE